MHTWVREREEAPDEEVYLWGPSHAKNAEGRPVGRGSVSGAALSQDGSKSDLRM